MNAIIQHSVLIVSGTQKGAAYITELLSPREFAPMTTALSGGDARRLLLRRSYDLVVINTPLPDEFGHELAEYIATQNRWQRFDRENQKLRTKMEEVRIVARAKCILVEYLRMSEQQAHRYIEKQAMDMRTSKKDVAENILKTYT